VDHFRYLGSESSADGSLARELTRRLALARAAFHQLRPRVFDSPQVSLQSKIQFYKGVVVSALMYGSGESWAPSAAQLHQLDVFNTKCLRRILGVRWQEGEGVMSNVELHRATKMPPISSLIKLYRLRWIGHVARGGESRLVHHLLFAHRVPGFAGREVIPKRWIEVARLDVADIGLDWYLQCQDKAAWEAAISVLCVS
jgi:hypothetical protein